MALPPHPPPPPPPPPAKDPYAHVEEQFDPYAQAEEQFPHVGELIAEVEQHIVPAEEHVAPAEQQVAPALLTYERRRRKKKVSEEEAAGSSQPQDEYIHGPSQPAADLTLSTRPTDEAEATETLDEPAPLKNRRRRKTPLAIRQLR